MDQLRLVRSKTESTCTEPLRLTLHCIWHFTKSTQKFIEADLEIEKDLKEAVVDAITLVPDYSTDDKAVIRENHEKLQGGSIT